jgi:hypothetical protein
MTQTIEQVQSGRAGSRRMAAAKVFLAALFIGAAAPQSTAMEQGTADERRACTPDVFRLCSGFIPDPARITVCLQQKVNDLSPTCRTVMSARPTVADRRR